MRTERLLRAEVCVWTHQARERRQRHWVWRKATRVPLLVGPINVDRHRVWLHGNATPSHRTASRGRSRHVEATHQTDPSGVQSTPLGLRNHLLHLARQTDTREAVAEIPVTVETSALVQSTVR